ncbi:MAG: ATP-dependent DNA helicase RecG [Christensenellales bacterium]|jgi:ATP-dependent DNA helicase RecG
MQQLERIKGLGPKRLAVLRQAGVTDLTSLLDCLPKGYLQAAQTQPIAAVEPGEACVQGSIVAAPALTYYAGRSMVRAGVADASGTLRLVWFNQPWMAHQLQTSQKVILFGRVQRRPGGLTMTNPRLLPQKGIIPQYRPLPGLPGKVFAGFIDQALAIVDEQAVETLPEDFRAAYGLCSRVYAWRLAHRPKNPEDLELARRRLGFENLLLYQMALRSMGPGIQAGPALQSGFDTQVFWNGLPFTPTRAQQAALMEIVADMEAPRAMRRLVQGDVGSGKTAVAFGAAVYAIRGGYQCALMAPTELLARQHYASAQKLLSPFGIRVGLLTGNLRAAERRAALEAIVSGEWQLVIGTHALISSDVTYHNLGLAITDEQHRFGVRQRQTLADRAQGHAPHILALSATPIPRSLALVLYGDLKVSIIDELPPGRRPVKTRIVPEGKRQSLYRYIKDKAIRGEQSYLVCPLVEDTRDGDSDKTSAMALYDRLKIGVLRDTPTALTYGSQEESEKNKALEDFYSGKAKVLVSTTVIEVGMDVPQATTMVIEDAEQFGLAQLHQLRGRVGRGCLESWCFLLGTENERLNILTQTNDGFAIAQKDLEQRGPGEFLGTRQHGKLLNTFGITDMRLVEETARCLDEMETDPAQRAVYQALLAQAQERFASRLEQVGLH